MSTLDLAIIDAATNCQRDGATATVTLKSGVQITGKLTKPSNLTDTHMTMEDGGWATIDRAEVAAVQTHPAKRHRGY